MLTAARSDLRPARVLAADDPQTGDVIGFHAQQTVEKAIKAVLVASGIAIPYTETVCSARAVTDIASRGSRGLGSSISLISL